MNIPSLAGKTAVIIGGGRGIGRGISEAFAKAGSNLVLMSRTKKELEETAHYIEKNYGTRVLPLTGEVTDLESLQKVKDRAKKEFTKIDILVNCAGITVKKPLLEISEEEWDRVLDINLKGTFLSAKVFGEEFVNQRQGKVITIASMGSFFGLTNSGPYCASKGGVMQLTKVMAAEWAPYNVTANAIAPGYIKTDLTEYAMAAKPDLFESVIKRTPMKRFGLPEEVAGLAVFFASDAANFITGVVVPVDGGFSAMGV